MHPSKKITFSNQVIFIDGMPGCGKTLFSQLLAAYPRVELLTYAYDIEQACALYYLDELSIEASSTLVNLFADQKIYHGMMSRETNFRFSDLSSVFNTPKKLKYFKRLVMKGDHAITQRILDEEPILNLTVHNLLPFSLPIFKALNERVTFIEIVRHPLYQIIQHYSNTRDMYNNDPRDTTMAYRSVTTEVVPYFVKEYEEQWIQGNAMDKAILSMYYWEKQAQHILSKREFIKEKTIVIPFENFVLKPDRYLREIESALGITRTQLVKKELKKQKVPRKKVSDGIPLAIYKRCGWEEPEHSLSEVEELDKRRQFAVEHGASDKALEVLSKLSADYESKYYKISEGKL
jgi:hypothetical protein